MATRAASPRASLRFAALRLAVGPPGRIKRAAYAVAVCNLFGGQIIWPSVLQLLLLALKWEGDISSSYGVVMLPTWISAMLLVCAFAHTIYWQKANSRVTDELDSNDFIPTAAHNVRPAHRRHPFGPAHALARPSHARSCERSASTSTSLACCSYFSSR